MQQQAVSSYVPCGQPQFVVMPVPQHNALGAFGFFVALVGLFIPTGIIALLGLALSLAAIGRSPRGMAAMGVVLGLIGTVFWLLVMGVLLAVGAVAAIGLAAATAVSFAVTNPEVIEVSSDMVNVAVTAEEYRQRHDRAPGSVEELELGSAAGTDPWGGRYRIVAANPDSDLDLQFDIASGGPDGTFGTDDDIRLSRLDALWSSAFERFEEKIEDFDRRMQALRHTGHGRCAQPAEPASTYEVYEDEARRLVEQFEQLELRSRETAPDEASEASEAAAAEAPAPASEGR